MHPARLPESDASASLDSQAAELAALKARLQMFERVLTNTPDVIARFDRELRHLYVSPAITQVTGLPTEAFIGKTNQELGMPEALVASWDAALHQVFATGEPQRIAFTFAAPDADRHYEARLVPELGSDGSVETVLGVIRDTTAQVEAEEALRESENRFRLVLQASPVTVFTHDRDLRYLWVYNPVAPSDVTGTVGRTDAELLAPAEAARLMECKRRVLETGVGIRREFTLTLGARQIVFDSTFEPLRDRSGEIVGLIGVAIDLTDRVRAEQVRAALERRIHETQRLESIGVLAGGIAHDFNNLLAIVLGNADLALADLPPDSAARASLQQIDSAARRAADLTRQLLIYAGHWRFDAEPLDLNDIVRDHAVLLEASTAAAVRLQLSLAAGLPLVLGDSMRLSQMLLNLVANASEAIGEVGGTIGITTALRELTADDLARCHVGRDRSPGSYVALTVEDTGSGIEAEILPRIFEPFVTTRFTGRGLGLAVVHGIVQRHGGAMQVVSRVGHGSAFTILLPATQELPPRSARVGAPARAPRPRSVLVVDDEPGVRLMAGRMVEHLGLAALLTADGRSAVELVRTRASEITCVLLDVSLPDADVLQIWQELRQIAPAIPLILMSGYLSDDIIHDQAELREAPFLQKPFALDALRAALDHVGAPHLGGGNADT